MKKVFFVDVMILTSSFVFVSCNDQKVGVSTPSTKNLKVSQLSKSPRIVENKNDTSKPKQSNNSSEEWLLIGRHGGEQSILDASKRMVVLVGVKSPHDLIMKLKKQGVEVNVEEVRDFVIVKWAEKSLIFGKR